MRALSLSVLFLVSGGAAQASVPALPCTSNLSMVATLKKAIDNDDLSVAGSFLSDDIVYGNGGFIGKQQVISAFGRTEWVGPPSRLVFATDDTLFFQRRTKGIHEQLVSFACAGQDFDARVVSVNMHRRNDWIEVVAESQASAVEERGKQ